MSNLLWKPQQFCVRSKLRGILDSRESLADLMAPRSQSTVVDLVMKKLRIKDIDAVEKGCHDKVRTMARKPYPAIEGMRNVQAPAENPEPTHR